MVQNIHIRINRSGFYVYNRVSNPVPIKVTEDEPYDKLSKKFNKYTHVIQYKSGEEYKPSNYDLCLDDPNAWYYYYILHLYKPTKKIISVEIFFQSTDKDRKNPLIFGFNYEDKTSDYYTYYYVRGVKYFYNSMGSRGSFGKDDLISRLIDERGIYESDSYHKFVIRLGDKPNDTKPVLYPKGGNNSGMIKLKKSDVQDQENYVSFEHGISSLSNVESFYVSFHQDTLYMIGGSKFGKLQSVLVYYNKYNGDIPVVVVFRFPSRVKLYRFSVLSSDFSSKTKNISQLEDFSSNDLKQKLIEEYKRVFKEITFKSGRQDFKNISVISDKYSMNNKDIFRRAILKPNTDIYNNGSSSGPYEVYNDFLFKKYTKKDFTDSPFASLYGQNFSTIYVYYTSKNEPLLIGFIGESDNKFFKITKGGQSWENDRDNIKTYNIGHLYSKLLQLEKEKNERVSHGKPPVSGPSPPALQRPVDVESTTHQKKTEVSKLPTQKSPKEVIPKVPKIDLFEIDLSKTTGGTYGLLNKMTVSRKNHYESLPLFCYFIHAFKTNEPFNISSLKITDSSTKTIKVDPFISDVTSVKVFFNTHYTKKPIMLEIEYKKNETKYYINVFQDNHIYPFSSLNEVKKEEIIYKIITESDRVNNTLTYQLEKSFKASNNMYGYNNSIKVIKNVKQPNGFNMYTHQPNNGKPFKSYLLLNYKLVLTNKQDSDPEKWEIQNKEYKHVNIYTLDIGLESPLIIELNDKSKSTTYVCKNDGSGEFWETSSLDISKDEKIELLLYEINYPMRKSVIIELDKNTKTTYDMRLIDNFLNYNSRDYDKTAYKEGVVHSNFKINVEHTSLVYDKKSKSYTDYKLISHTIPDNINGLGVAGIRFFLTRSSGREPEEITLYETSQNSSQSKNKLFFHYPPKSKFNKIYGYFYGSDSRPLLICYDRHIYKRLNINDNTKWILEKKTSCSDPSDVISLLQDIHKNMKRKLTFLKTGELKNITVSREEKVGSFKRIRYTANTQVSLLNNSFILTQAEILKEMSTSVSIRALLDGLKDRQFDTVSIYYESSRKMTFLCEFIDDSVKTHFQRVDNLGEYWIEKSVQYTKDLDLAPKLTQINSNFNSTVVYEIDKITTEYNASIKIVEDHVFEDHGFTGYRHYSSLTQTNLSLILYRNKPLVKKDSKTGDVVEFTDLETKPFKDITVYFGNKADVQHLGLGEDVPLVIVFHSSVTNEGSRSYYRHRRDYSIQYWEPVITVSSVNQTSDLLTILKQTEFDFLKSLVILTDFTTTYGEEEIRSAIAKLNVKGHIIEANIDDKSLTVVNKDKPYCFLGHGFKYREYHIDRIKEYESYGLRFFLKDGSGNKYNELSLHSRFSSHQEYLIHNRGDNNNKVYVFFYGNDPRPLLISYGNSGFSPNTKSQYEKSWYKLYDDIDPEWCNNSKNNLIGSLSEVVGFMNEVQLDVRPHTTVRTPNSSGYEKKEYNLDTYDSKTFMASVSYRNLCCYRVYRHEHIGTGSNGSGFRFGSIKSNKISSFNLVYDLSKQLYAVSLYYSIHDVDHRFPLLVELEYRNVMKEFFMPVRKNGDLWFILDQNDQGYLLKYLRDSDSDNFEYGLYQVRQNLDANFDTDSNNYLFSPEDCKEGSSNTTVIAAASGGTVTTAALVGAGTTLATHPEWVIPVLKALT